MRANGDPMRASSATYTTSHASARPSPVPSAAPCTAAKVGAGKSASRATAGFSDPFRIASPSSLAGSASARSRPAQKPRPSPRTISARTPAFSAASSRACRSATRAALTAFILSGRFSTSSPSASSTWSRTVSPGLLVIRPALLGGEDLELTRADRLAVLVEDVPAVRDDSGLRVAILLLEMDRVADPRSPRIAQLVGPVVREDRRRVGRYPEAGADGEHHDPGGDALAEHRALGCDLVDVRVVPVAGQRTPAHDVGLGDRASARPLRFAHPELVERA